ncbi:MAG: DUF1570 domain-containing protein [Phycisphaera sp.]|nr:DUF1570 domain-containing protein [Phycisphaera sp.]
MASDDTPRDSPARFTDADFAEHVRALKARLPGEGFTIVIEKPFVVVGDESPERVSQRAASTVRWATTQLKQAYFESDPLHILDIWLFKDKESYEKNAEVLFGSKPHTPYGYYSSTNRALVMNIATGGGTLVHEIVHPFMEANFPECPAWFNEGLGSLYEQSAERDGQIVGLTNWRLAGLKDAIKNSGLPSFKELTVTTSHEFYTAKRGNNYAQARYLCYYLQQRGKLREFYQQFHDNHADDPTGYATLVKVLNEKDMAAFQARWEKWVMQLHFP